MTLSLGFASLAISGQWGKLASSEAATSSRLLIALLTTYAAVWRHHRGFGCGFGVGLLCVVCCLCVFNPSKPNQQLHFAICVLHWDWHIPHTTLEPHRRPVSMRESRVRLVANTVARQVPTKNSREKKTAKKEKKRELWKVYEHYYRPTTSSQRRECGRWEWVSGRRKKREKTQIERWRFRYGHCKDTPLINTLLHAAHSIYCGQSELSIQWQAEHIDNVLMMMKWANVNTTPFVCLTVCGTTNAELFKSGCLLHPLHMILTSRWICQCLIRRHPNKRQFMSLYGMDGTGNEFSSAHMYFVRVCMWSVQCFFQSDRTESNTIPQRQFLMTWSTILNISTGPMNVCTGGECLACLCVRRKVSLISLLAHSRLSLSLSFFLHCFCCGTSWRALAPLPNRAETTSEPPAADCTAKSKTIFCVEPQLNQDSSILRFSLPLSLSLSLSLVLFFYLSFSGCSLHTLVVVNASTSREEVSLRWPY